jgi:hypothetical protein
VCAGVGLFTDAGWLQQPSHTFQRVFLCPCMNNFKEVDIENFIWENIKGGSLARRGLILPGGIYYRQFPLGGCGVMDMVGVSMSKCIFPTSRSKNIHVKIYELKKGVITCNDVGQIARYIGCFEANTMEIHEKLNIPIDYHIGFNGVLIGAGIERDACHILTRMYNVSAIKFDFSFSDGITFEPIHEITSFEQASLEKLPQINFSQLARLSNLQHKYPSCYGWRLSKHYNPKLNPSKK